MRKLIVNVAAILALLFAGFVVLETYDQTCLGIIQNKTSCEIHRQYKVDFKQCRSASWQRCEAFSADPHSIKYETCIESIRCGCMSSKGHAICSAP